MKRLKDLELAESIFGNWEETIILSCLQGVMGEIWVDNDRQPQSALAKLGKEASFGFLAGRPNIDLLELCRGQDIILVPQNQVWADFIEDIYKGKAQGFIRYATEKNTIFDEKLLKAIVDNLPSDFELRRIDHKLYDLCLEKDWSQDLVANYDNITHYQKLGLGVAILHQGQLVAGASSYSTYQGGIEIEIDTHPAYRRRGLAKIAGAKLILECLARGLYPSWDAHTKISLYLAQQLGYQFAYEYIAYVIDWKKET